MKKYVLLILAILIIFTGVGFLVLAYRLENLNFTYYSKPNLVFWSLQSIDTMKYSRDLSREKLDDPRFDAVIDTQVKNIAAIGATHVVIATPYDKEFIPMLQRWVSAARKYKINVWFRGNWSGWERWFDYPQITPDDHIRKTKEFILSNSSLFEDGDIFSSCPECENGVLGDPRSTGDTEGYRKFIIEEYRTNKEAFKIIDKKIQSNFFSMNGDVARLVMDKDTTVALGGIVTIDHYVETPKKIASDIKKLAVESGGKIVLGEFGAPIPDIHGEMTPEEQAQWINKTLALAARTKEIIGVNYWLNIGGSTEIWDSKGSQSPAVEIIRQFYRPEVAYGAITDSLDYPIVGAEISNSVRTVFTDKNGYFEIPVVKSLGATLKISALGFKTKEEVAYESSRSTNIILVKDKENLLFKIKLFIKNILK